MEGFVAFGGATWIGDVTTAPPMASGASPARVAASEIFVAMSAANPCSSNLGLSTWRLLTCPACSRSAAEKSTRISPCFSSASSVGCDVEFSWSRRRPRNSLASVRSILTVEAGTCRACAKPFRRTPFCSASANQALSQTKFSKPETCKATELRSFWAGTGRPGASVLASTVTFRGVRSSTSKKFSSGVSTGSVRPKAKTISFAERSLTASGAEMVTLARVEPSSSSQKACVSTGSVMVRKYAPQKIL
mmetsp:Transcript_36265/g.100674  ORF Transcript_36265/g.100674 Transcript_36265/m.100674 type:complete len:248 (-) Transcript_36265:38-781(-)